MKQLLIVSSHRKDSNTTLFARQELSNATFEEIDLLDYHVDLYSYEGKYSEHDQFGEIVDQILAADHIVFATPVYWYSMSSLLKITFDRITDLVTINKDLGRQLKGKSMSLITTSGTETLNEGFVEVFSETARYMDMTFIKATHKHCK